MKNSKSTFTDKLLRWENDQNQRKMPWKGERNPYKIWLSEIILQQTRVEQGWKYYENFISAYPSINELAAASDEEVFKLWEGLGYYTRCKNLLHTARYIVKNLSGVFPNSYDEILNLKGVGPYTAAAISSFAYGHAHAVLDGNVFRVLSRYFGEALPIDSKEGKAHFTNLSEKLLYKADSALYNQSIMDFGATVCKPKIPKCVDCVMQRDCVAFNNGLVNKLPVKEKRLTRSVRWFYYFLFTYKGAVLVNRRSEKDIWQSLYEFYLFEADKHLYWDTEAISIWVSDQLGITRFELTSISKPYRQQLTHQNINAQFIGVELFAEPKSLRHLTFVKSADLPQLAFPKIINMYLDDTAVQKSLF